MVLEMELTDEHASGGDVSMANNFVKQIIPFCLRVLEINGSVYEHTFQIMSDDSQRYIDIPVHCKVRKPHRRRRRRLPNGEIDESPLPDNNDNEAAAKEVVLTPPIKWIRPDPHWSLPFARFFVNQTDLMCCSLLLKDGLGDVRSQLYALQSINRLTRRKAHVHEQVHNALEKVIMDARSFFQVRIEAVRVMCDIGPSVLQRVLSILARKFGIQYPDATSGNQTVPYSLPLRANNFTIPSDYFLQRSFAQFLPLCAPDVGNLGENSMHSALIDACTLVQLEVDFLRYNDNTASESTVSDSEWIADVFKGLGTCLDGMFLILEYMLRPTIPHEIEEESFDTLLFDRQPTKSHSSAPSKVAVTDYNMILGCLNRAVQQIDRYVTREHILPSHRNTILQAIIRHPWSCLLKHSFSTKSLGIQSPQLSTFLHASLTGIPNLLLRYSGDANYWGVRLAAFEVRTWSSVQCIIEGETSGWAFLYEVLSLISRRSLPLILSHHLLQIVVDALIKLNARATDNPDLKERLIDTFNAVHTDKQLALQLLCCFLALYPVAADDQEVPPLKLPTSLVTDGHLPPSSIPTESQREAIPKVRIAINPQHQPEAPAHIPRIQLKPPPPSQDSSPQKPSQPLRVTLRLSRTSLSQ